MLRAAIWAAVSSEEQFAIDKVSIPDQLSATQRKAQELGATIVAQLIISESRELLDFTTACGTIATYQELKQLADRKEIDLLIFLNRGRLGRTAAVIESLALYCLRSGVALFDLSAPPSTLVASEQLHSSGDQLSGIIQSWRYQNELTELRRRHHRGMINRIKRGQFAGSIPYGWKRVFEVDGNSRIEIDEQAAQAVRRMFQLFLANETLDSIAALLNDEGYYSPGHIRKNQADRVKRPILKGFVVSVLAKPMIYAGHVEVNRYSPHGREHVIEKSNVVPPIIDEATALRILEKQNSNRHENYSRGDHLYSGMVTCTRCQRLMTVVTRSSERKRKDGTVKNLPAVRCSVCERRIAFTVLSRHFIHWLESLEYEVIEEAKETDTKGLEKEAAKLQSQIESLPGARSRAYSAYVDGLVDRDAYQSEVQRLEQRKKELQRQLSVLNDQLGARARLQAIQQRYDHVKDVGQAMIERGKTDPITVNRWLREYIKIRFGENREVSFSLS